MGTVPTVVVLKPVLGAIEYKVLELDSLDERLAAFLSFFSGRLSNRFDQSLACVFFAFFDFFENFLEGNPVETRAHFTFMSCTNKFQD